VSSAFHSNIKKSQIAQALLSLAVIGTASKAFPGLESLFMITPLSLGIVFILFLIYEAKSFIKNIFHYERPNQRKKEDKGHFSISFLLLTPYSLLLLFALWAIITSTWSIHPKVTLMRSGYLLFLIISIFTAVYMIDWKQTKYKFGFLLPLNIIVVITSLISLILNIPEAAWTGGNAMGFTGFTSHQNTLAALILFTSPSVIELFWMALRSKGNSQFSLARRGGILNSEFLVLSSAFFLLSFSFYLLVLTYSRASIASFLILIIILLLLQGSKLVLLFSTISITALILSFVLIPSLRNSIKNLLLKDTKSITETRLPLWNASYKAALNGGLFGLGYGISHLEIKSGGAGDHYENGRFVREKGNSILAMIEEVGIIGLTLFIAPIVIIFRNLFMFFNSQIRKSANSRNYSSFYLLSFSFLLGALFHAQFESWWVGVGSFQLLIFLLILFQSEVKYLSK